MDDQEYNYIKNKIFELIHIDLNYYKSNQMIRRLEGYISRANVSGVIPYCNMLEQDQEARTKLRDFLTINVSEFYRDSAHFEILQTVILPELMQHSRNLKIWSAGCSHGAEPYSIAIMLEQLTPFNSHRILGTDLDDFSIKKAIAGGPYSSADIKNTPDALVKKYFTFSGDGYWIIDRIRQKVKFKKHDLMLDAYDNDYDLIICRNVVIYFCEQAKKKLNRNFYNSLKHNGVLFIGATETMLDAGEIGFQRLYPCFYRKPATEPQCKTRVMAATTASR